jgi:hypothetical protein
MRRHGLPDLSMRQTLSERGLECHLLMPSNPSQLCPELNPVLVPAYKRTCTPADLQYETWAITLKPLNREQAVACLTLSFHEDQPSYFLTRFEAVHPSMQRQGVGRLLYDCTVLWTRFLLVSDALVIAGVLNSFGTYHLVSYIDAPEEAEDWEVSTNDNEQGHGTFLKKLGFARAQHDFGQDTHSEIAFSREFHVPITDYFEAEVLGQPARPASV